MLRWLSNNLVYSGPDIEASEESLIARFRPGEFITVDCETVSTKDNTTLGIGVGINEYEAFYVPTTEDVQCSLLPQVMNWLSDPDLLKVYHNGNFDIGSLRRLAVVEDFPEPDVFNIDDTAMMAQITGHKVALETIGNEYLEYEGLFSIQDLLNDARKRMGKKTVSMLNVPWLEAARKCCNDVLVTWEAYEFFKERLQWLPKCKAVYDYDIGLLSNLKMMEQIGLQLDKELVERHYRRLNTTVTELRETCDMEYGFNIGSPQQVAFVLANRGHQMPFTKNRKALRSPEDILLTIDDDIARMALEFRKADKLLSTYIKPWRGEDRAYTHFRLDLSTGRLASYDRNMQNIPSSMREIFAPDTGSFTVADMSQVEMRVFAYVTKEPKMLEDYANGVDIHGRTMDNVIKPYFPNLSKPELRGKAKIFNFAMIYYGKEKTLAERCGIPLDVAAKSRQDWLDLYPTARNWMDDMYNGRFEYVEDIFGRRMRIITDDEIRDMAGSEWKFKVLLDHVRRTQVNYPIQASAASLNKRAMMLTFEFNMPIRLQVHDEFLWDGQVMLPEEFNYIHPEIHTPWEVHQGPRWEKP